MPEVAEMKDSTSTLPSSFDVGIVNCPPTGLSCETSLKYVRPQCTRANQDAFPAPISMSSVPFALFISLNLNSTVVGLVMRSNLQVGRAVPTSSPLPTTGCGNE